ncbi:hypothetical protein AQPE_0943 [Aquipluma nitroreducens]|uniref:Uncharacterized protein n=1 Tax=Aquipluma nitroreducens TaxID=2010828 RepID=A0A5K7S5J2_9BACT|nr:hypothetical protein AQPE_0943 [Aquipluma nitroreducens]
MESRSLSAKQSKGDLRQKSETKTPKISDGFRGFYFLKITANIFIRLFDLSFDFCNFAA